VGRNSSASIHITAIKIAERPKPTIALEIMAILKSGARPKHTAPKEAIILKRMMVFLAPRNLKEFDRYLHNPVRIEIR
jgi:hypothetical protein